MSSTAMGSNSQRRQVRSSASVPARALHESKARVDLRRLARALALAPLPTFLLPSIVLIAFDARGAILAVAVALGWTQLVGL